MIQKKKSILFLLPNLYPCVTGGIEIFHHYFIQAISDSFDVYVCTCCNQIAGKVNLQIIQYKPFFFDKRTISIPLFFMKNIYKLRKKISLIHVPYTSKSLLQDYYLLLTKYFCGVPYVLRIHGGGMYPSRPFFMHQLLFENAAGIIGVSTPIKTEYEKRHGQSITMIPSMLPYNTTQKSRETLRRKYGFESCDIVILFLGSVKSIKGPDLLLKAFQSFGKRYIRSKKIKLLYSGDGPLRKPLKKDAVAAGIENHVIFLGNIPHENVCELYKLSDIYVLPSLMEARPLSLSEALYNGLPSIGSDIPTISNIISDNCNGLIFLKNNWKDLKHRLELLIEDSGLRTKLGEQAKKSYRKIYKFDTMIEEYCRFYKSIL